MRSHIISELLNIPVPVFVSKWILERPVPYLFHDDHQLYLRWKSELAPRLGVDSCSLLLIGGASVGISFNPNKNFKEFDNQSDIDIAVISPYHFEEAWRFLRNLGSKRFSYSRGVQEIIKAHASNYIYWGTVATDKILPILPFGEKWVLALNDMACVPPTESRDINLRIYKDFESLRSYQIRNLYRLRDELVQNEKGST